ncbi:MAG: altronate dehydratase family protein [Lachnospiraceae bacterium]|nr:altronate dehydratase family protein [Lachnospiraceae bacterium]
MDYIKINENDNVCVALKDLSKGTKLELDGESVVLTEDITRGHKIALKDLKEGENVIKYGSPIGHATKDIEAGSHIHIHNLKTNLGEVLNYTYHPENGGEELPERTPAEFMGFVRKDGTVGVRNEIWIIPTVGCVNPIAAKLAEISKKKLSGTVDDVLAFAHPYGCSQMGEDQEATRTILADLIKHPNAGGVLVLGLGCENSNIGVLKSGYLGEYDDKRIKFLQCQDVEDELEEGEKLIEELIAYAGSFKREKCSADKLVIGLKCGGSDGLSGITANPTVGLFSDILCSMGGTTILTEVPEMFGAETMLMDRCETPELFNKTVCLINNFKEYYIKNDQTIYENPSPGNKAGGISTLEDKSLGCTQKSGKSKVRGVLEYGERVKDKGLNLLSAPGNDLVAATALAASGAQIVLFTTGRGTPFAAPVPTAKISTNSALAGHKEKWIDFNCGVLTEGKNMQELAGELFKLVTDIASGKQVKSEIAGFHDLAIFKRGVTL